MLMGPSIDARNQRSIKRTKEGRKGGRSERKLFVCLPVCLSQKGKSEANADRRTDRQAKQADRGEEIYSGSGDLASAFSFSRNSFSLPVSVKKRGHQKGKNRTRQEKRRREEKRTAAFLSGRETLRPTVSL